jgi:hypothetical protein
MMGSMSPQVIGTLAALLFPSVVNSTLQLKGYGWFASMASPPFTIPA